MVTALAATLALAPAAAFASSPAKAGSLAPKISGSVTTVDGIAAIGEEDYPATYGGEAIDPSTGGVIIYVTSAGVTALSSALSSQYGSPAQGDYTIEVVPHSWASLTTLTSQIETDDSSLSADGIDLTSWGPDAAASVVNITLGNYSQAAVAALDARYGASYISVSAQQGPLPVRTASRFNDTVPFWAGNLIWFDNDFGGDQCTSGFGYRGNGSGKVYGLTAGHCEGSSVWTDETSHAQIGAVTANYFGPNTVDIETFNCNCGGYVWSTSGTNGYRAVTGTTTPPFNSQVTLNGAFSGEQSNLTVFDVDICQEFEDGITTCGVSIVSSPGGAACQNGDSGGPVYQRSGSNAAVAAGIIIGGDDGAGECFYNDISNVLSAVGGSILTG